MKRMLTAAAVLAIAISPLAAQTNEPAPSAVSFADKQTPSEVLGSDFIGAPVTTRGGQKIGSISNLVFDQDGRIELAVIGVGGFLGIGAKEVAVPFESVKPELANSKHTFVIDATKEQIEAAPTYRTLDDQALSQRVASWRAKAAESWAKLKRDATKAYEDAKARVNETQQPKPAQ